MGKIPEIMCKQSTYPPFGWAVPEVVDLWMDCKDNMYNCCNMVFSKEVKSWSRR